MKLEENICSCIGERSFKKNETIENQVKEKLIWLIENLNINEFYFIEKNPFSSFCHSIVDKLKEKYNNIKTNLVISNLTKKYDEHDKKRLKQNYASIIFPPIENSLPVFRMLNANNWIVKNSKYILFYVDFPFSNSRKLMENAKKKKIMYKNFGSYEI